MGLSSTIVQADKVATLFINRLSSPITDFIWESFSDKDLWFPLYLTIILLLFWKLGTRKAALSILAILISIIICDQFGNICKEYFERLRPCHDLWMRNHGLRIIESTGNLYGFYSAHAANAMGFAVCSSLIFNHLHGHTRDVRIYTAMITLWAVLVGISRILVGKHYLGDVLAGFAIGVLIGWAAAKLSILICKTWRHTFSSHESSRL